MTILAILFGKKFSRQWGDSVIIGYTLFGKEYVTRVISPGYSP